MKTTKDRIFKYLSENGRLRILPMGETEDIQAPKDREVTGSNELLKGISEDIKVYNRIVFIAVFLLGVLFLTGVYLVFHHLNDPVKLGVFFTGTSLSFFGIITWLRRLWKDLAFMKITSIILEKMSPEDAINYVESIYWSKLASANKAMS